MTAIPKYPHGPSAADVAAVTDAVNKRALRIAIVDAAIDNFDQAAGGPHPLDADYRGALSTRVVDDLDEAAAELPVLRSRAGSLDQQHSMNLLRAAELFYIVKTKALVAVKPAQITTLRREFDELQELLAEFGLNGHSGL